MAISKLTVVLPPEVSGDGPVALAGYQRAAGRTDRMPPDLATPILGLFGEIGSLLAALKKKRREGAAYTTYDAVILEELGDVLWYLNTVASRTDLDMSIIAQRVSRSLTDWDQVKHDDLITFGDVQLSERMDADTDVAAAMAELAARAGELVEAHRLGKLSTNRDAVSARLVDIFRALVSTAAAAQINLDTAARGNLEKTFSRWPLERRYPPQIDVDMPSNERLPRKLSIFVQEHQLNGKTYVLQKCNDVIIGDRLTDNKAEKDDYRFHDVFHIAYAVHLGWSPVLRSLLRVKRRSRPDLDENEDGARAILIEEGIATFIFGRALERRLFEGLDQLDYDLLKLIQDFVKGFEPDRCSPWQWERAILDGFRVFRELKAYRQGWMKADLDAHTLDFEPVAEIHNALGGRPDQRVVVGKLGSSSRRRRLNIIPPK